MFVLLCFTLLASCLGCSGAEQQIHHLLGVEDQDKAAIQVATSRQLQLGYQISSVAAQDDALDFCHEMCTRSAESCGLSDDLCAYSRAYPDVGALVARCRVSRERCKEHRRKVPRQCICDGF
ncbi:MAG TPA: hypothetical protein DCQ06_13390 [Myxococcales bacterium]|nr:hypothetical protein [Myxococcales bacterium]HAN32584.1 hypothetical protein [Myxococcales bacterium]